MREPNLEMGLKPVTTINYLKAKRQADQQAVQGIEKETIKAGEALPEELQDY